MKIRSILKQFDTIHNFGFTNLIVGGCSFTYNNSENHSCTWPYYLRDMGGFSEVYDFSMVGGGNMHIKNAMIYGLEKAKLDMNDSLIIVQWAGHDRDDYIIDPIHVNHYPFKYYYEDQAVVGITGGEAIANFSDSTPIQKLQAMKTPLCRSIENFVTIKSLESYLKVNQYKFLFFEYRDYNLPGKDSNFDPKNYLNDDCKAQYAKMMTVIPDNFYRYCLYHDLMMPDNFHPSPDGHLQWTRDCFLPFLTTLLR